MCTKIDDIQSLAGKYKYINSDNIENKQKNKFITECKSKEYYCDKGVHYLKLTTTFPVNTGITFAVFLKRLLIHYINGYSIVALYIKGVSHYFENIDGVNENVQKIISNIKKITLLNKGKDLDQIDGIIDIKNRAGQVYAKDIKFYHNENEILITNPDQIICTLNNNTSFQCHIIFALDHYYKKAEEHLFDQDFIETYIKVDSLFSDVSVSYEIIHDIQKDIVKWYIESEDSSIIKTCFARILEIAGRFVSSFIENIDCSDDTIGTIKELLPIQNDAQLELMHSNIFNIKELSEKTKNIIYKAGCNSLYQFTRMPKSQLKDKFSEKVYNEVFNLLSDNDIVLSEKLLINNFLQDLVNKMQNKQLETYSAFSKFLRTYIK